MHLAFTQLLLIPCIGEQVDLLDFPPVCLPSDGQSFAGLDGKVAGKISPNPSLYLVWTSFVLIARRLGPDRSKLHL